MDFGNLIIDGKLKVHQDVKNEDNEVTKGYCKSWIENHKGYLEENCLKDPASKVYNSSKAKDIQGLSCALEGMFNESIRYVLVPFILNKEAEENDYNKKDDAFQFFENFKRDDLKLNKLKKNLIIYDAIFDLSTLPLHTTESITETVLIWADTVYMTKMLEICYNLTIRTRVASLTHPILMKIDEQQSNILKMKPFRTVGIDFHHSALTMRHLSFGMIDIFDKPQKFIESKCSPATKQAMNYTDASWFDKTYVDLMYVYARSLIARNQSKTANEIANTILHLYANPNVVNNNQAFIGAKKFEKIRDIVNIGDDIEVIHQVPRYSMEVFEKLCNILYSNLKASSDTVLKEESILHDLENKLIDLDVQFGVLESSHQLFFETENKILEEVVQSRKTENQNTIYQTKMKYVVLESCM